MKHEQYHGHRQQTGGCQEDVRLDRVVLGILDQQMQTDIYIYRERLDKEQVPTVQHRELCSITCGKP